LTTNADGSEKLEPWLIGKSKNPRCFKNINRKLLGVKYKFNKLKWIIGLIMEE
jgi:DDE superfamily endonuclease